MVTFLNVVKNYLLRTLATSGPVSYGQHPHVGPYSRVWAPSNLTIGNNCYIGKHVTIECDGQIGDEVIIANNVGIVGRRDHDFHELGVPVRSATWVGDHPALSLPVTIGSDIWIGFGAIILSGVTVGDSSVIAAGSIVFDSIPENTVFNSRKSTTRNRFSDEQYQEHWKALEQRGLKKLTTQ